jgi:SAM-dependent methyltransferase
VLSADAANRRYFRKAYRAGRHGWAVDAPSEHVVGFLERVRDRGNEGRLLDLGCGEGRHAVAAAGLGFRVTAVDYEPLAVRRARALARARGVEEMAFQVADVFALPFAAGSFDVVLDYGCLHHQRKRDWAAYVNAVLRVLTPEGYYLLSAFSPRFRMFRGGKRRWHIAGGAYRRCFTSSEIRDLFGRHFEVLEMVEERGEGRGLWHVLMERRGEGR